MLADLSFWQIVAAGAFQVLLTALLVGGIAAVVVKRYELEHQTRGALRETYAQLLVAQRRLREACLDLAREGGAEGSADLQQKATSTLAEFIDAYHRLNLDASRDMWKDARGLRHVLEDMLKHAEKGDLERCEDLKREARHARQNLERSFRIRLSHKPLQKRRLLAQPYEKHENGAASDAEAARPSESS
jgi:hypothetical protein